MGHLFNIYLFGVEVMSKKKIALIIFIMCAGSYTLGSINKPSFKEIIYAVCSKAQGYQEVLN